MSSSETPTLENEHVKLVPLHREHISLLKPIAMEPELWKFGLSDLSQPGEFEKYIESALKDAAHFDAWVWTVIDKQNGEVAGCTRLAEISTKDRRAQIGWTWIGKAYQGSGLNKAMKSAILSFCFDIFGFNRIELKADERNMQSRKAMLKLGAKEEGILRQHMRTHDGFLRNTVFYSILKEEWENGLRF